VIRSGNYKGSAEVPCNMEVTELFYDYEFLNKNKNDPSFLKIGMYWRGA
jgi:hypothetical protein